jgi:hypothetical protein
LKWKERKLISKHVKTAVTSLKVSHHRGCRWLATSGTALIRRSLLDLQAGVVIGRRRRENDACFRLSPMRGYGAWEFIYESMLKIQRELWEQGKSAVRIKYQGDLDPSGKDIPRFLDEQAIEHFKDHLGVEDFDFKDIGLSPEQVTQYQLPQVPKSEEVMEKIHRDPRLRWHQERYPPDVFVELGAFYALATSAAQKIIRDAVEQYFDEQTYQETREDEKNMKEEVHDQVREKVTFKDEESESP